MGVQYRFDMTVDPEPRGVTRVAPARDNGEPLGLRWARSDWLMGYVWHRLPCRRNHDVPPMRRGEAAEWVAQGARHGERRFKRGAKFKRRIAWTRRCLVSVFGTHLHWDTKPQDKCRSWGSFRGTTKVINVDAFSRMRSQYRAKKRKW